MIYVISPEDSTVVKIGHTTVEPARRVAGLQTGNPQRLVLRWSGDGDDMVERHLHVVFADYRVQGEWFDLAPLGDPVQAVKEEVRKAQERLARGESLLVGARYHYPVPRSVWAQRDEEPEEPVWDPEIPPEMRRGRAVFMPLSSPDQSWDERFPPVSSPQAWDERFPPVVRRVAITADRIVHRSANGEDPKPSCIRVWKGRCRRPAGTTCDSC